MVEQGARAHVLKFYTLCDAQGREVKDSEVWKQEDMWASRQGECRPCQARLTLAGV